MWRAVRKEVTSTGDGGGGPSENMDCRGVAAEGARALLKVSRKDEKPREVEAVMLPDGDAGRPGLGGLIVPEETGGGAFFFPVNGRRNDHSDSNWTESYSDSGE